MGVTRAMPVRQDLEIVAGTDDVFEFTFTDEDDVVQDIGSDTIKFSLFKYVGSTAEYETTNTSGEHVGDGSTGKTRFTIPLEETDTEVGSRKKTRWWYEVRRAYSGVEAVWFHGYVLIHPSASSAIT